MKRLLLSLLLGSLSLCAQAQSISQKIISFKHDNDPTIWQPHVVESSDKNFIFELIPQGQSPFSWRERVVDHIIFTHKPLAKIVADWKAKLKKAGPDSTFIDYPQPDGSLLVDYYCKSQYDGCIRRFIQGPDAIYSVAYYVRPLVRTPEKIEYWKTSLSNATLVEREAPKKPKS